MASTGFAKATHNICGALHAFGHEVHVLGVNYYGYPHEFPYKIYPAYAGGDLLGFKLLPQLVKELKPDIVILQTDPWHVSGYLTPFDDAPLSLTENVQFIGVIAVDGKNTDGTMLNDLDHVVFWTEFARDEAVKGGYIGTSSVIGLGVDTSIFNPVPRASAREQFNFDNILAKRGFAPDVFMVGCVGRNQWRKRLDLTVEYFAEWVHDYNVEDAVLWLHVNPTSRDAWDLKGLVKLFDVEKQVLIPNLTGNGVFESQMAVLYNSMDLLFSTTLGEGFGLPMFEAMACGIPLLAPRWSALGELATTGALLADCTSIAVHPEQVNTVGGVMDRRSTVALLHTLYSDSVLRGRLSEQALKLASSRKFDWQEIGSQYLGMIDARVGVHAV